MITWDLLNLGLPYYGHSRLNVITSFKMNKMTEILGEEGDGWGHDEERDRVEDRLEEGKFTR